MFSGLIIVLALMAGIFWLMRWLKEKGHLTGWVRQNHHLKILEFLPLDSKRQLMLVENGTNRHLLLLGPTDLIISTEKCPENNQL